VFSQGLARSEYTRLENAFDREWLVTNGLGGFACGTVSLANTRRYHGLLVASLRPPVERVLMLGKVEVTAQYRGQVFELASNEFADKTLAPRGFELLSAFRLEEGVPVWLYALSDALLEQRLWMGHRRNVTYITFTLRAATAAMQLEMVPLCTYRDYHSHTQGGWWPEVSPERNGCRVAAFTGAHPYHLHVDRGEFSPSQSWYWHFYHRAEEERGLDAVEDLFRPGVFRMSLDPGDTVIFTAAADGEVASQATVADIRRDTPICLSPAMMASDTPEWIRRLAFAANQFIVQRGRASGGAHEGMTVIAGYPWFSDWGRDTMIALPGLMLATGRTTETAAILRTYADHLSQGMLPNRFPDNGEKPEYNSVDASLWYFHAIAAYVDATHDQHLLSELYPALQEIIGWYRRGTRYGIHQDPADGLLHAGEPGVQLTWMDGKVGDWVVTPRIGKAVEVNALWHHALERMGAWANTLGDPDGAAMHLEEASKVAASFADAFWFERGNYLYDVVDGLEGTLDAKGRRKDPSLRPNQIFAVALATNLLQAQRARAVVDTCARELLTPVGLRSLSPRDPRYCGTYSGGPRERDSIYHQGVVWSWLLGPFALAHYQAYSDANHAKALLEGIASHLDEACLGTISEILEGSPPHRPRGCMAQAWSVGETYRAWHYLERFHNGARAPRARAGGE
jgi:predicted glycogen debranching enzyme